MNYLCLVGFNAAILSAQLWHSTWCRDLLQQPAIRYIIISRAGPDQAFVDSKWSRIILTGCQWHQIFWDICPGPGDTGATLATSLACGHWPWWQCHYWLSCHTPLTRHTHLVTAPFITLTCSQPASCRQTSYLNEHTWAGLIKDLGTLSTLRKLNCVKCLQYKCEKKHSLTLTAIFVTFYGQNTENKSIRSFLVKTSSISNELLWFFWWLTEKINKIFDKDSITQYLYLLILSSKEAQNEREFGNSSGY